MGETNVAEGSGNAAAVRAGNKKLKKLKKKKKEILKEKMKAHSALLALQGTVQKDTASKFDSAQVNLADVLSSDSSGSELGSGSGSGSEYETETESESESESESQ